jgi:hypothetical protein
MQPWQTRTLAYSRLTGWLLAVGVVALFAWGGARFMDRARAGEAYGRTQARAFIEEVRACHRAPPPHPSWADCERLVRARE